MDHSIETLLNTPEDELYRLLAKDLAEGERNLFPRSLARQLEDAKALVAEVANSLRVRICSDERIRQSAEAHDSIHLVILISDMMAGMEHVVHATVIAVLIVRIGVRKICSGLWGGHGAGQRRKRATSFLLVSLLMSDKIRYQTRRNLATPLNERSLDVVVFQDRNRKSFDRVTPDP